MSNKQDNHPTCDGDAQALRLDRTLDSTPMVGVTEIRQRFEEAWKDALAGLAPPPQIEAFLRDTSVEEQPLLTSILQDIERQYRQRGSTHRSDTIGDTAKVHRPVDPPPVVDPLATAASAPGAGGELDFDVALPTTPPLAQIAGYEVLGRIGHGGMGVVYKVRHVKLDRIEALKMVLAGAHAAPEQLARFRAEAQAVAQLQHPNIVQVYENGESDGLPYFSLEYVGGGSLAHKLGGQPLPPREAAHLTQTLSEAIEYAHKHAVLHRDLKPANILLTEDGAPKVTDFGLAKRLEGDVTQTRSGTIQGTPSYMAPEQARGDTKATGPAIDVYGLGAILYECLTGRPPFVAATHLEILKLVLGQEPVPPCRLRPSVPRDLETICLKCLQKAPAQRYLSAAALARDLGHFLAGEPIEARPVGPTERFWRLCRRNPGIAALAGVIFVLLLGVAITSSALLVRISREKDHTERERKAAEEARDTARENEEAARAAEKLAATNAQVATEQSRLAVDTLASLVTRVQTQLRAEPGNHKLRQQILGDALTGLERVVGKAVDDPQSRWVRTAAYQHMGDIALDLGRTEEALTHYRECQKITELMEAAHPDGQVTRWNLAVIYDKLGDATHRFHGDGAVARDYYLKCLDRRKRLVEEPLTAPELKPAVAKANLAETHSKLGDLAMSQGDPATAWDQYRKYLDVQRGRTFPDPRQALAAVGTPEGARLFPTGLANKLGELSFHLGDVETSRGWYARALRQSREAVKRSKGAARDRLILSIVLGAVGDQALQLGDPAAARVHYAEAHELVAQRATADPTGISTRRALSLSHYRLGAACRALGETAAADKHFRECLTIREGLVKEDPANVYTQIELALVLARSGRHADAVDRIALFRKRAPNDPGLLFHAACTASLCSTAAGSDQGLIDRYRGEAVASTVRAIELGYRDAMALEHDPDLDAVRGDPRFREAVRKLKATDR